MGPNKLKVGRKSVESDNLSRASDIAANPPKHRPTEVYCRLISGNNLETDKSGKNMFFCVFYVHDGSSKFRINKSTTKQYLQTPEVHSKNGCPKWDCFEEFPVKTERDFLTIKVFRDRTKLGCLNVPAWDIPLTKGQNFSLPVMPKKKRGFSAMMAMTSGSTITVEVYVSKHEPFILPKEPSKRMKFIQSYLKAMRTMKDIVLLETGTNNTPAEEMLNASGNDESAILTFMPTSSPTASRTKVHIRGRGLGKSKNDIKSVHICGLDVTATLEHLNSTSLKVTTSFWKESLGKITIVFSDGTTVESSENFEFHCRENNSDINSLLPGGTRASQTSQYTEFVPRTNYSPKSTFRNSFAEEPDVDKVDYTGEINFPHHEKIYERGTNEEIRKNYRHLIDQSKKQQEHLHEYMKHSEKLMTSIVEEAPHLMTKTKTIKSKRGSNYYERPERGESVTPSKVATPQEPSQVVTAQEQPE